MNSEDWKQIDEILDAVSQLPADQQDSFLGRACGGDFSLEQEVRSLLRSQREMQGFLESPALEVAAQALAASATVSNAEEARDRVIGPYRLVELLGTGGMGEVWKAAQSEPLRRSVAIKLIKAGMDTRAVVARFDSERQALAKMDHPNIAKVFDAGETPAGRPYFVMEHVAGIPITEYCDQRRLTLCERLALFLQVCEGVQHAHQRAVIHRDLKPSNILVEQVDGRPVPKIIDFGLAKATRSGLADATLFTEAGIMVGTPAYMSPEQADSNERDIDTRTDVYTLGVILYELLTGSLPFEVAELRATGLAAMLRKIREEEPPRPSARASSAESRSKDSPGKRREAPQTLVKRLRGELDWITLKALEKERDRRYGSPSELAADIQRHLEDRPVLAGPPSAAYRAGKFVRRHRFGVGASAALALLIVAFSVAMAAQARRIAVERDRANREAAASRRVSDFMTDMFRVSDPGEAKGNSVTAREILDKASTQIESGLGQDRELRARLLNVMGTVYTRLGLLKNAQPLLEQSLQIRGEILGNDHPDTLDTQYHFAWLLYQQGHYPEAEKLMRSNLQARQRILGPENPETLKTMDGLASELDDSGKSAEAEPLERKALELRQRVLGREHRDTLDSMNNLAGILTNEEKYQEADDLYRRAIGVASRTLGENATTTLWTKGNLAWNLHMEGKNSEAEALSRDVIVRKRTVFGAENPGTLMNVTNLAEMLREDRKYQEAEKMERETQQILARVLGPNHPQYWESTYNLARLAALQNRSAEALSLLEEIVAHGFHSDGYTSVEQQPDFQSLRANPRFARLLARIHANTKSTTGKSM